MKYEIKIDEKYSEPQVVIYTNEMTDEVNNLIKTISNQKAKIIIGYLEDQAVPIQQNEIIRIFANSQKVFVKTQNNEYSVRERLYELEEKLDRNVFFRISKSEIVNLRKIKRFDLSFTGTIGILLTDGSTTYASRRYVSKIKDYLEMR